MQDDEELSLSSGSDDDIKTRKPSSKMKKSKLKSIKIVSNSNANNTNNSTTISSSFLSPSPSPSAPPPPYLPPISSIPPLPTSLPLNIGENKTQFNKDKVKEEEDKNKNKNIITIPGVENGTWNKNKQPKKSALKVKFRDECYETPFNDVSLEDEANNSKDVIDDILNHHIKKNKNKKKNETKNENTGEKEKNKDNNDNNKDNDIIVEKQEQIIDDATIEQEMKIKKLRDPKKLKQFMMASFTSVFFLLCLTIWAFIVTGDMIVYIPCLGIILVLGSYIAPNAWKCQYLLNFVYNNDTATHIVFKTYRIYSAKSRKIRSHLLFLIMLHMGIFSFVFMNINYNLKSPNYNPTGVFDTFQYLSSNGKALFLLLIFNFAFGFTTLYIAQREAEKLYNWYIFKMTANRLS